YVWLYVRGGQGVLVASNDRRALDLPGEASMQSYAASSDDQRSPEALKSTLVLSPKGVDRFISTFDPSKTLVVSTDNNLYLEYSTPKGNALGNVVKRNIDLLSSFEAKPGVQP
ncbi:MAG: hypothetical protein KKC85_15125, partial [Gammaproteobacteria bacterium]|nr:hypothetical protein [Gammaproteobacteria bacterium]